MKREKRGTSFEVAAIVGRCLAKAAVSQMRAFSTGTPQNSTKYLKRMQFILSAQERSRNAFGETWEMATLRTYASSTDGERLRELRQCTIACVRPVAAIRMCRCVA